MQRETRYFAEILRQDQIELDQRLQVALSQSDFSPAFADLVVFYGLLRSNAIPSRYLLGSAPELLSKLESHIGALDMSDHWKGEALIDKIVPKADRSEGVPAERVFGQALQIRKNKKTLSTGDFIRAIGSTGAATGNHYTERPFLIDFLAKTLTGKPTEPLGNIPQLRRLLDDMAAEKDAPDDFQYLVTLEQGRLAFRVASVLNDYLQLSDSGLLVPQRALIAQLGDIGFFTKDQVEELEDLMNSPLATEGEFQNFFERYPHFLRQWDHREVHPHVMLTRNKDGPLIPDFILTNREAQSAAILDLKRTLGGKKKLIRRQDNRMRFADAIQEARAQLRTYGRWFENPDNRRMLKSKVGMEIYSPRLMVVIGRSSDFQDEIERATLRADNPDIDVITYDDIARHARDRMVIVKGG